MILTAAHCVQGAVASNMRVVAGMNEQNNYAGTQTVNVAKYLAHPNYGTYPTPPPPGVGTFADDLAIVYLAHDLIMDGNPASSGIARSAVIPAVLATNVSNTFNGETCVVAGWSKAVPPASNVAQKINIQAIGKIEANYLLDGKGVVSDNQIAVYDSAEMKTVSGGDDGGPIMCNEGGYFKVVGIVSWGIGSGGNISPAYPAVATRVSSYANWISTAPPPPPASACGWVGSGRTIQVTGSTGDAIKSAIGLAQNGDTVVVPNGTWYVSNLSISKNIRLTAATPLGATIQRDDPGKGELPAAEDSGDNGITITGTTGGMIEGLIVKHYDGGIVAKSVKNVTICGNRVEENAGQGIKLTDTVDVTVKRNKVLDAYRTNHFETAIDDNIDKNRDENDKSGRELMDYGVAAYGTTRTIIIDNYFQGQFNQVISFKTANRNYSVIRNTIEGFSSIGMMLGQNVLPSSTTFTTSNNSKQDCESTPLGEVCRVIIDGNILRPVAGPNMRPSPAAANTEYLGNTGLVVGNLKGATVTISNNTMEGCFSGIVLKNNANVDKAADCTTYKCGATGTLTAHHNIINGRLSNTYDSEVYAYANNVGSWIKTPVGPRFANGPYGQRAFEIMPMPNIVSPSTSMSVTLHHETYVNLGRAIRNNRNATSTEGSITVDRCIFAVPSTAASVFDGTGTRTPTVSNTLVTFPVPTPSGVNNISADPKFVNSAIPELKYLNPNQVPGTTDFRSRFKPQSTSQAVPRDAGAVPQYP